MAKCHLSCWPALRCCNSVSIAKIMEKRYSATLDDYNSVVKGELEISLMVNAQMLFKKFSAKAGSWIKISRLHFYPMPWIAYSLGTAAAYSMYREFNLSIYVLGYVFLFLAELCSVLTNEYFDFKTDRQNKNSGFFNGGSRCSWRTGLYSKK